MPNKIPAIKLMESKTFAPELCKFYAAYMFVVGVVYSLWVFVYYFYLVMRQGLLSIYHHTKEEQKVSERFARIRKNKKMSIFGLVIFCSMMCYAFYGFLNGGLIGYSKYEYSDTYFIDDFFEMLFYIDFLQGFMICFGIPFIFWGVIVYVYIVIKGKQ